MGPIFQVMGPIFQAMGPIFQVMGPIFPSSIFLGWMGGMLFSATTRCRRWKDPCHGACMDRSLGSEFYVVMHGSKQGVNS